MSSGLGGGIPGPGLSADPTDRSSDSVAGSSPAGSGSASDSALGSTVESSGVRSTGTPRSSSRPGIGSGSSSAPSTGAGNGPAAGSTTGPASTSSTAKLSDVQTTGPGDEKVTLVAPDGPISDAEAKNRREIEAAWLNTWRLYESSDKIPAAKVEGAYSEFTTGKALTYYVEAARAAQKLGFRNVGKVGHRLSWGPPVGSFDDAGFIDCMDQSEFGYVDTQAN
ncbi:hypothetical protein [Nakamurella aerolata]|uniref:Uncharacterized protein n=1 Tax=Nakamurella aerolata TaxID=1656892 RepID=A0A849A4T2_9ACTN|nr:hypothetical protein [Nakamurella aerolata]NNG35555.1 hypothetical protein [Nakamurella aerolata]